MSILLGDQVGVENICEGIAWSIQFLNEGRIDDHLHQCRGKRFQSHVSETQESTEEARVVIPSKVVPWVIGEIPIIRLILPAPSRYSDH